MKNEKELSMLTAKLNATLTSRSKPVAEAIAQIEKTGSMLDDYVVPLCLHPQCLSQLSLIFHSTNTKANGNKKTKARICCDRL